MTTFSQTITLEFLIQDSWVDFTRIDANTKMLGDGANAYTIVYGINNEAGKAPPMSVTLDYLDTNGVLNEFNTLSPYYGLIVQYTRARILVDGVVDIIGEISSITVKDDKPGAVTIAIEINSVDRRLFTGQRAQPLRSPAYRSLSASDNDATRILYYPLEEDKDATTLVTPFPGMGTNATYAGAITFGDYTNHPAAERMLTFGALGRIDFTVPDYTSTEHKLCALFHFPTSLTANSVVWRMYCTGGNTARIDLEYGQTSPGTLRLLAYAPSGALIDTANFVDWNTYISNKDSFIALHFTQNGADLDNTVLVVNQSVNGLINDTLTAVTIGRIYRVTAAYSDCTGLSMGHFIMGNDVGAFDNFISPTFGGALGTQGFIGEPAGYRIIRLLSEEGQGFNVLGSLSDSAAVGVQRAASLESLLTDCQAADGGILFCQKDGDLIESLVSYRTARSLYSQYPVATISVSSVAASSQLSGQLKSARDDQNRRNDVTVTRNKGATARYTISDDDTEHYSTLDPPNGMGPKPASLTLQLATDAQARQNAAWEAHLGAWKAQRFPGLEVAAWRDAVRNDAALAAALPDLMPGDLIRINTSSATSKWIPRSDFYVMFRGYQATKAQKSAQYKLNCTPGDPWDVDMIDTRSSTLALAVSSSDTTLWMDMSSGPAWKSVISGNPYYVQIDGDVMKVTLLDYLVPSFGAAGAVAHGNNASVSPGAPAGAANGNALILMAAIRNSGTGTVDLPSGWTDLTDTAGNTANFGNFRIMGRYRTGVAADTPTVTFTGGAAGADTSAVIMSFPNASIRASWIKTQLNGSAQNIAYPRFRIYPYGTQHRYDYSTVGIAGWKQDDNTGITVPAGFTEDVDASTTTGNDQSFYFAHRFDAVTADEVAAGSLTVSGGAAAISRSIVFALRPLQQATVERGISGVAASHAVGTTVKGWRVGVIGL